MGIAKLLFLGEVSFNYLEYGRWIVTNWNWVCREAFCYYVCLHVFAYNVFKRTRIRQPVIAGSVISFFPPFTRSYSRAICIYFLLYLMVVHFLIMDAEYCSKFYDTYRVLQKIFDLYIYIIWILWSEIIQGWNEKWGNCWPSMFHQCRTSKLWSYFNFGYEECEIKLDLGKVFVKKVSEIRICHIY